MLRSGVDIFVLQRLMGHADLQVLRRYLAQNDEDNQLADMYHPLSVVFVQGEGGSK